MEDHPREAAISADALRETRLLPMSEAGFLVSEATRPTSKISSARSDFVHLQRTEAVPEFGKVRRVSRVSSMAPIPVWSGNLRLSLVLVPVRMFPAISTERTIAFRMIHEPSGQPIKYLKGVETERGFEEVLEEEIIKGYEPYQGPPRSHQARGA